MKGMEKVPNYFYKGFVIQKVAPSTYEVYGPRKTDEAGRTAREQVGKIDSLAGAKDIVDFEETKPIQKIISPEPKEVVASGQEEIKPWEVRLLGQKKAQERSEHRKRDLQEEQARDKLAIATFNIPYKELHPGRRMVVDFTLWRKEEPE